jgi:hydroxypyruvate isomerase
LSYSCRTKENKIYIFFIGNTERYQYPDNIKVEEEEEEQQDNLLEPGLDESLDREEEEEESFLPLAIKEQAEKKEEVKVATNYIMLRCHGTGILSDTGTGFVSVTSVP